MEAHRDAALAYAYLKGMESPPADNLTGLDLGGRTLSPGVHRFNSSARLTGALTLDAGDDSGACFVLQIGSSLTTGTGASVVVINGGADYDESNVYWQGGSSATLGTGTDFTGNILAYASISMTTGTTMVGNALALSGAVTLEAATVTFAPHAADRPLKRPTKGSRVMTPPEDAPVTKAGARIGGNFSPEKRRKVERSRVELTVKGLDPSTGYTLRADNPSTPLTDPVQFDTFTTSRRGRFTCRKDTRKGDALPFGMTLANLPGVSIEVPDSSGTTVLLEGTIPSTAP